MTERRTIPTYRPRIQIPVNSMFSSPGEYALYCLPIDGAQALQRIAPYLTREVTYIYQPLGDRQFLGPTEAEMLEIRELVGELEVGLMSGCDFSTIVDALIAINSTLDGLSTCVCEQSDIALRDLARLPNLQGYVDNGSVTYDQISETLGSPATPGSDEERCELAQAFYQYIFQTYTEILLPYANNTADVITDAIITTSLFGALASWVGVPVAILSAGLASVVAWGIDGSIANFTNWLLGIKDEFVCTMYAELPDYAAAAAAIDALIDAQTEISFLDKALLKAFAGSEWHMTWVALDQQTNGTYDEYIQAGFCDDCEVPAGCAPVIACNLSHWTGGVVECVEGRAWVKGGTARYIYNQIAVPNPGYMWFQWIPRWTTPMSTPRCKVWLYNLGNSTAYYAYQTPYRLMDTVWDEYFTAPTACWGNDCQLMIQQDVLWSEPQMYCAQSTPWV